MRKFFIVFSILSLSRLPPLILSFFDCVSFSLFEVKRRKKKILFRRWSNQITSRSSSSMSCWWWLRGESYFHIALIKYHKHNIVATWRCQSKIRILKGRKRRVSEWVWRRIMVCGWTLIIENSEHELHFAGNERSVNTLMCVAFHFILITFLREM